MAEAIANYEWLVHTGPKEDVEYPLKIVYCDVADNWPLEYCEHHPNYEKAKQWMEDNLDDDLAAMFLGERGDDKSEGGEEKKRQKRGGKGQIKTKKEKKVQQGVCLSRAPRGKKKSVTVVSGLATYEIDLKVAAKFFSSKFACSSSVTGDDEIIIQGDVKDDLFDIIPEKWPQIDEDSIDDLGDQKRS